MADSVEPVFEPEDKNPEPQVEESTFEFELDDGVPQEPVVSAEELQKKMDDLTAEKEQLSKQADSNAAMTAAFGQLADKLGSQNSEVKPKVEPSGPPQLNVNWDEIKAKVNDVGFKDPFAAQMTTLAPIVQQINDTVDYKFKELEKKNKLVDSKLALMGDSELQETYGKYKVDIEVEVAKGKDYLTATREAKMAHIDDIIAERVAAEVAKLADVKPSSQQPAANSQPAGFTNSGNMKSAAASPKGNNKPRVSAKALADMRQYALNKAFDPNDAEDMNFVYETFKDSGYFK